VYGRGVSEEIVGRWLAEQSRDDLVLATKVRFVMGDGPNELGASRKHILAGVEGSLRRLRTDHIDLYQIHCWDPVTPLEETLGALDDLVRAGKVRYIGASNFTGYQLQRAIDLSRRAGWAAFVALQPQYSLLCRQIEWELVPVCQDEGIGVIPWSPLRGGWLSGKFRRGMETPPAETRVGQPGGESWAANNTEATWAALDALTAVAAEVDRSPAQVALRWLLQRPAVTAPIVGARSVAQLDDNLGAADGWALSPEQMARLDEASAVPTPYPYDFIANAAKRR
jgi:aryl-alcohol dehydrogenase-like predicted oxidoreductase